MAGPVSLPVSGGGCWARKSRPHLPDQTRRTSHTPQQALIILEQYFTPHIERMPVGGNARVAPSNILQFDDLGLTQPFSDALHVAAQGNPQRGAELISGLYIKAPPFGELRYARAIMLLAIGRRDEARFELHIAARLQSVYPHDYGPHQFQWSALTILERLAHEQTR